MRTRKRRDAREDALGMEVHEGSSIFRVWPSNEPLRGREGEGFALTSARWRGNIRMTLSNIRARETHLGAFRPLRGASSERFFFPTRFSARGAGASAFDMALAPSSTSTCAVGGLSRSTGGKVKSNPRHPPLSAREDATHAALPTDGRDPRA